MLQDIKQFRQDYRVLIQTIVGFVVLAILMIGVGGTIYRMIAPDGWLVQIFGASFSAGTAALLSLVALVGLSWFSREWVSTYQKNRLADVLIYVFAGAGVVYLAQMLLVHAHL